MRRHANAAPAAPMTAVLAVLAVFALLAALAVPSAAQAQNTTAGNDPDVGRQWGLLRIGAPQAWSLTRGRGARIGIVDTGIDLTHEDLAGKVVAHAKCVGTEGEASRCRGSAQDDNGHGTHVAGIASAVTGNGLGVAGVAPDAELVVAKVLSDNGSGTADDVVAGIHWVVDQGAQVVNLSLGDPAMIVNSILGEDSFPRALEYAWAHGAVPVIAAGNSNLLGLGLEGRAYGDIDAIVVGASDRDDHVTRYSTSTGRAKWAVLAPGGSGNRHEENDIWSTYWTSDQSNAYAALAGTSMATPHVTGAIALLLAQGHTRESAVQRLLDTAVQPSACGSTSPTCRGRIDVARAVGAR